MKRPLDDPPPPQLPPPSSTTAAKAAPAAQRKKRHRVMKSCISCHANKRKCDRGRPCSRCIQMGQSGSCVYETEGPVNATGQPFNEAERLRNRIAELESVVRQLKDRRPGPRSATDISPALGSSRRPASPTPSETESSRSSPGLEIEAEAKVEPSQQTSTSRGGSDSLHHPRPVHAPPTGVIPPDSWCNVQLHGKGFYSGHRPGQLLVGATAAPLLIHKLDLLAANRHTVTPEVTFAGLFPDPSHNQADPLKWHGPTDAAELIPFLLSFLPSIDEAQSLLGIFHRIVDLEAKGWHTPAMTSRFAAFFRAPPESRQGYDRSFLSFVFAVLGLAAHVGGQTPSLSVDGHGRARSCIRIEAEGDEDARQLISNVYVAAAMQLLEVANIVAQPTIESLQARICVGLYLLNSSRGRRFANILPVMIRDAQRLGLHIDPKLTFTAMPVVEAEIRRRLWWQIMDMDMSLSLFMGWPTLIASNDTALPADRTEESLCGPNVTDEADPLPQIGVTVCSFIVYRLEVVLYAREVLGKSFGLTRWLWSPAARELAVPPFDEVSKIDAAIKIWYSRIPPALCFEIDTIEGTPIPEPRPGTTVRDLDRHGPELAQQSLMLAIHAHAVLLILHRPFLQFNTPWHDDLCMAAARQCFVSALTIVLARCRLGEVPLSFWIDGWAFSASLTLGHLWSRSITSRPIRRAEMDACHAGLRALIDCFAHLPGGKDRSEALADLEEGLLAREHAAFTDQLFAHQAPPVATKPETVPMTPITPSNAPRSDHPLYNGSQTSTWSAVRTTDDGF